MLFISQSPPPSFPGNPVSTPVLEQSPSRITRNSSGSPIRTRNSHFSLDIRPIFRVNPGVFIPGLEEVDEAFDLPQSNDALSLLVQSDIARRYARGESLPVLADSYNVPPDEIKRVLARVFAEHRTALTSDAAILKTRELLKIEELEREYWKAWENCVNPEEIKEETEILLTNLSEQIAATQGQLPKKLKITQRKMRPGTQYLQGVERCIRLRLELMDLMTPAATSPTVNVIINSGLTTDERIDKLSALLTAAPQSVKDRIMSLLPAGEPVVIDAEPQIQD